MNAYSHFPTEYAGSAGETYVIELFEAACLEARIRKALDFPLLGRVGRIQQRRIRQELAALKRRQEAEQEQEGSQAKPSMVSGFVNTCILS